jgi:hypothetical protein
VFEFGDAPDAELFVRRFQLLERFEEFLRRPGVVLLRLIVVVFFTGRTPPNRTNFCSQL